MSLKKIAASTPWRRTGCSVISLASSGVQAGVEHRGADAQLAVLGQGAPGLAHEPDRRALGPVTAQGSDQRRRGGPTVTERV